MKKFKVYRITHHIDETTKKFYIGLTERELEERLRAHFNEATRKHKRSMDIHSLKYAIWKEFDECKKNNGNWNKVKFEKFSIELIKDFDKRLEMQDFEYESIKKEGTLAPKGYNLFNGGHSIGGKGRGEQISLYFDNQHLEFSSQTEMYKYFEKSYRIKSATLRLRVKNEIQKRKTIEDYPAILADILYKAIFNFKDIRKTGGKNSDRQKKHRDKVKEELKFDLSKIIYPDTNNNLTLNANKFATENKLNPSTVRNRAHKFYLYNNINSEKLPTDRIKDFKEYLISSHASGENISFTHEGKTYAGTLRSLSKKLNVNRSTAKKRYSKLNSSQKMDNNYLCYVFGLIDKPIMGRKREEVPSFTQKKLLMAYKITDNCILHNQKSFVLLVYSVLKNEKINCTEKRIRGNVSNYVKSMVGMQDNLDYVINKLESFYKIDNLKNKLIAEYNRTNKQA